MVAAAPHELKAQVRFELPCPDCRMSERCLTAKRKELGSLLYDREIQTSPRTSESSLFPATLTDPLCHRTLSLLPYYRKPYGDEERWKVVQAWDLAWSEKVGGDWLVCMTGRLDLENGQRRLLDVMRWQQKTFDEQVGLISEYWRRYAADVVVIESDASQRVWKQHVGRNTAVPVVAHEASEKRDFATGVPSLLILLENKKWEFPSAPEGHNSENMKTFLSELEAFGMQDGKLQGVGEHDDTVMAWWHLNWGMDKFAVGGWQKRTGRVNVQTGAYI